MALNFTRSTGDGCNFGSAAVIDNFTAFTFWAWIRPTTFATDSFIFAKGLDVKDLKTDAGATLSGAVARATTDGGFDSTTTLTANVWQFIAFTFSTGDTARGYLGTLSSTVTEVSYSTQVAGSGAVTSDAASNFMCPDDVGFSEGLDGDVAIVGYHNAQLTLGQLRRLQFVPRVTATNRLFAIYGYDGASTVIDYSGNGNTGTATGGVVVAHVPLRMSFGLDYASPALAVPAPAPASSIVASHLYRRMRAG